MAGGGYDISASLSNSATASNASPFSSTGGSKTVFTWQAALVLGLLLLIGGGLLLRAAKGGR